MRGGGGGEKYRGEENRKEVGIGRCGRQRDAWWGGGGGEREIQGKMIARGRAYR